MLTQLSFSTSWSGFKTDKEAMAARNKAYNSYMAKGFSCKRWALKNQLKQYSGLGIPDNRICDVYMLNVYDND
jgi:hypothetical protein